MIGAYLLLHIVGAVSAVADAPAPAHGDFPACPSVAEPAQPCSVPIELSQKELAAKIGTRSHTWWLDGDRLTVIARPNGAAWPSLCCAIQGSLPPIGATGLAGTTLRIPRIDEALLDVGVITGKIFDPPEQIRGANAPAAPPAAKILRGTLIRTKLHSTALNEDRGLTIYVPPDVARGEKLPVIYLADGETAPMLARIAEASADNHQTGRAIIVGIHNASGPATGCLREPCDKRTLNYIPNATAAGTKPHSPFGRHLTFIADELIPWVERTYPASNSRENRILSGVSSGAVWAFSTAALRPKMFGKVLAMSSGNSSTTELASNISDAQIFTGAGTFEPSYLESTKRRADFAKQAGARVKFREIVSGHTHTMWDVLFAEGLEWLLPPRAQPLR